MYTLYLIIFTSTPCASVPQILPHSSSHFMSSSFCVFFIKICYYFMCMCVCLHGCVYWSPQGPSEPSDPLEQGDCELQRRDW